MVGDLTHGGGPHPWWGTSPMVGGPEPPETFAGCDLCSVTYAMRKPLSSVFVTSGKIEECLIEAC